jgi:uncharacterized membrane protein
MRHSEGIAAMEEQVVGRGRVETFCDGVIAIIITIMVLELKVPHDGDPATLIALWPIFLSYILSFLIVAIYWVNHHRMFHECKRVDNMVLWSTIFWLFCISLVPFATAYMNQSQFASFPTAVYAATLLLASFSYVPMRYAIFAPHRGEPIRDKLGARAKRKNYISLALYAVSVPLAYVHPALTLAIAFLVAAIYFFPNAWLGENP